MIYDLRGKVTETKFLNSKIKFTRIELKEEFHFVGGQFVNIEVGQNFWRSYSIASSPDYPEILEFLVDVAPGGQGSQFFSNLNIGSEVHIKGPFGRLVVDEGWVGDYCFVATGTGIAPFRSMYSRLDGSKVKLLWGLRYKEDIILADEFKNIAEFCISLSRPNDWNGEVGHITECLKEKKFGDNTMFYLCGNNSMIEDAKAILQSKGVSEDRIKFEKFF